MLAFKVIGTAVGLLISLFRTVLILSVKYWKVSLPVFGLLLIFKFSTWWGIFLLLPITITIIVLVLRRRPEKGLTVQEREVKNGLVDSTHLQDFFAPLSELRFVNSNGSANTHARKTAVKDAVVSITPTSGHGGASAFEVVFRVSRETDRFASQVLPAMRNELFYDDVTPMPQADHTGGFYKVRVTPEHSEVDVLLSRVYEAPEVYEGIPMGERNLMNPPIAIGEDGEFLHLPIFHTIISGQSGAGKGGPLQSLIAFYCTAPEGEKSFWEQGLFTCYMIDPKEAEFPKFANSFIPERVKPLTGDPFSVAAASLAEIEAVIAAVHERMLARQGIGRRSFIPSVNTPLLILFWDEFSSTVGTISKDAAVQLNAILSKGRSLGIFLVAATQDVNKSTLGSTRGFFANKILLRLATAYDAETLTQLPREVLDSYGVKPAEIIPATQANGQLTSGLGWLADDANVFKRVRFFYASDKSVTDLAKSTTPPELWVEDYEFAEGEIL